MSKLVLDAKLNRERARQYQNTDATAADVDAVVFSVALPSSTAMIWYLLA